MTTLPGMLAITASSIASAPRIDETTGNPMKPTLPNIIAKRYAPPSSAGTRSRRAASADTAQETAIATSMRTITSTSSPLLGSVSTESSDERTAQGSSTSRIRATRRSSRSSSMTERRLSA